MAHYKINREIEADKEAVDGLGDSKVIISVLKKFLSAPFPAFATSSAIADYETLEPRIKALIKQEKNILKFSPIKAVISIFFIIVLGTIIIMPVQAFEMHMPQQDTTMLCLNDDSCVKWCEQNKTVNPATTNVSHPYSLVK